MKLITVLVLILLAMLYACNHDPQLPVNGGPSDGEEPSAECSPDTVYFVNTIGPLLNSSCAKAGCHDNITQESEVVMTDYNSIITTGGVKAGNASESELFEVISGDEPEHIMPPPPNEPLSSENISQIEKWINQGALNNECLAECDTADVTYSETLTGVIATYCLGCHNQVTPSGDVLLDNYNNVIDVSSTGRLTGSIKHETGYTPMPSNGEKLSDCEIRKFEIWIENGYPQ